MRKRNCINTNCIIYFIPFILILLSLGSIGVGQKWAFIIFALLIFASWVYNGFRINFTIVSVLWIYSVVLHGILILLPSSRISHETISVFISACISMGYVLVCKPNLKAIRSTVNIFIYLSAFVAIYVILVRTFPNEYLKLISSGLDEITNQKNIDNLKFGYGPAIGASYTLAAVIMNIGFFACLTKKEWKYRYSLPFISGIIFAGIILYGRKAELLACIFALFFYIAFYLYMNSKLDVGWRHFVSLLIFFVVLVSLIGSVNAIGNLNIHPQLESDTDTIVSNINAVSRIETFQENIVSNKDPSSGRLSLYSVAFRLFLKQPLFGYGWQQFANYKTGVFVPIASGDPIRHAHNDYLQMLFDIGIIGTMLMYAPLIIFLWKGIRAICYSKYNNKENSNELLFCASLSSFFVFYGALDPVFCNPISWIVLAFVSSVFDYCRHKETEV